MKITAIRVLPLGYTKKHPPIPRSFALVRVETDAGYVGYGEASSSYGHFYPTVLRTLIDDVVSRALLGKNPLDIRQRLRDMHLYLDPWLGWEGLSAQAIGALEIALWDIKGQAANLPVAQLLGAEPARIPLYGTGTTYFEKDPAWHAHFFDDALQRGFSGVKVRIGKNPQADLAQIEAVRQHIGPDVKLMVDAYWSYSVDSAVSLARRMEPYDVFFFEEPIPQYQLKGLQRLRAASPVRIALGERIYSLYGFDLTVDYQAADVLQPDATVCGGILECLAVADLARANGLSVIPHIGGLTAVGIAANVHLAAAINCTLLEYDLGPYQPLRDQLLRDPIFALDRIEDGQLCVPQGPGLGIEVDEAAFERFAYKPGKVYPDIYPQLGAGRL